MKLIGMKEKKGKLYFKISLSMAQVGTRIFGSKNFRLLLSKLRIEIFPKSKFSIKAEMFIC